MRPLLFCSLLAVSLATIAPAAPVPTHLMPKDVAYYPTQLGAKWVWEQGYLDFDWQRGTQEKTFVVIGVETTKAGRLVTVEIEDKGKQLPAEKMLITSNGLYLVERNGGKFDPPVCCLKLPHKPGECWQTTTTFGESKLIFKHSAIEPVEVKVPAGRFQTLPVVEESHFKDKVNDERLRPETVWYGLGVGRVRSTMGGWKTKLQSFNPRRE